MKTINLILSKVIEKKLLTMLLAALCIYPTLNAQEKKLPKKGDHIELITEDGRALKLIVTDAGTIGNKANKEKADKEDELRAKKFIGNSIDFKSRDINGNLIDFSNSNKLIVLNCWFVKCIFCYKELQYINETAVKYKDKVNFVAMTFESREDVLNYKTNKAFKFSNIEDQRKFIDNFHQITDSKDKMEKLGVKAYPVTFIIKKGKILDVLFSIDNSAVLEQKILKNM